ncbi:MAG: hypothetical protein CVV64_20460 [Candidatus Wallbacteria bacterium HGW-Wallbacteria-1]|jgi:hypothetical protein|uniref:Uncharacterized protein n=1 Tax=Candidatus Wallbacteria bacterium HGW-Wallbacteria-1 TaxID=2013854 RepID=A0A2N1PI79_9BACT|nr:MAG: hypothetical protein CVV64_20460 [Candidatus Wallbacteria bacterium HGW-Wallbacteria-1]
MDQNWILQRKETRRTFSKSTWVPLRAHLVNEQGDAKTIGYSRDFFGCGSVAFPPKYREIAENLSWTDIGLGSTIRPNAYEDGFYSTIDEFQYPNKEPIGVHLVLELSQYVVGGRQWILDPDLVAALHLIKEGENWVRPEENFVVVAREVLDEKGEQKKIEIKREFLLDYLAARNLTLRLSYYRGRVENVASLGTSEYAGLKTHQEERDGGRYELLIRDINEIYGRNLAVIRVWQTDVDEEEDAPVVGPANNGNTDYERYEKSSGCYDGVRVEGEFWRDEWVMHQGESKRVRGDVDTNLPQFIVETDGMRLASTSLKNGRRWLWFRPGIINELLDLRGFSLDWYTAETGGINSTSGCSIHFGINTADLITVYAKDISRLPAWEQHIWVSHNVAPDGKVSSELLDVQVKAKPASTHAVEEILFEVMDMLEEGFQQEFGVSIFLHNLENPTARQHISRFSSKDLPSLLRLAKEVIRIFSDRLAVRELRKLSTHKDKANLGSNKLLQDILAQKVGEDTAREVFGTIVGVYDMRVGDAHPTSSKIEEALKLAGIDDNKSFLRQGEQLISNFGKSIYRIGELLFENTNQ